MTPANSAELSPAKSRPTSAAELSRACCQASVLSPPRWGAGFGARAKDVRPRVGTARRPSTHPASPPARPDGAEARAPKPAPRRGLGSRASRSTIDAAAGHQRTLARDIVVVDA